MTAPSHTFRSFKRAGRAIIALPAMALFLTITPPVHAEEMGDGHYQCQTGLASAFRAIDRQWTPIGARASTHQLEIKDDLSAAVIDGLDYECRLTFFEFLGCTTCFYHFAMNINSGRFTFDKSYGFIRGETPAGDAEEVSTSLGVCVPDTKS